MKQKHFCLRHEQALHHDIPAWATAAFVISVFGGILGCLALLIRKKWATPLFIISFIGILVHLYYNLFASGAIEVYGLGGMIVPVMVLVIAVFFIWYSKKSTANGWIS